MARVNTAWGWVKRHSRGLKEAAGAIAIALAIGFVLGMLSGCGIVQELEHSAKFEHRSSVPAFYDRNTADELGYCMVATLGQRKSCGLFCPKMEGCLLWEVHGQSVWGGNPGGELSIRLPFAVQQFE